MRLLAWQWWAVVSVVTILGAVVKSEDAQLILTSTGPVALDLPIWFTAELTDYEEGEVLDWQWSDDVFHAGTVIAENGIARWNLTYDHDTYVWYTGLRTVYLNVKKKFAPFIWIQRASNRTQFRLTSSLNGEVSVIQPNVTAPPSINHISTTNTTNLTAVLYDPHDWLKRHTEMISFFWVINNNVHASCSTPSLVINITEPGDYSIQANVYIEVADHVITTTTSTTSTTTTTTTTTPKPSNETTMKPPTTTPKPTPTPTPPTNITTTTPEPPSPNQPNWKCDGYWPEAPLVSASFGFGKTKIKLGYFHVDVSASEPITQVNVSGNTWLKHGELLNLSVVCSGSQPWGFCYQIKPGNYNVTGNETCNDPIMTNDCNFPIIHYFRDAGTHTYLLIIQNDVSLEIHPIPIVIYNVDRKPQLSYIIIPVSCSLLVIIIVIFGVAYFIQSRSRYSVEVADFDFGASEQIEYKTLWEQLKEGMTQAIKGQDWDSDEDTKWRDRSHVVERPRILEEED